MKKSFEQEFHATSHNYGIGSWMIYRVELKGPYVLLSETQAGPGRAVKQEQEENSRNHVQAF